MFHAALPAALAEETFLASVRLRGGFDTNPTLQPAGASSAFVGLDAAFAAGREANGILYGVVGDASTTRYLSAAVVPVERGNIVATIASKPGLDELGWRSTTTASSLSTYDTRSADLIQSLRLERDGKNFRSFVTAELRMSELNETNAIFPTFLPTPHRFARATLIPGGAIKSGPFEVGASVNLSATHYMEEFDVFGFRRRNERVQPFLFVKYRKDGLELFANVSRLYGFWHDPDYSDVARTLFEVSATYTFGKVSLELGAQRVAAETTFPLSPITVQTVASAKARLQVSDKTAINGTVRYGTVDYLDTPLSSRLWVFGLEATHELQPGFILGAEVISRHFDSIAGLPAHGVTATISVMRRFGSGDDKKKRAEAASAARRAPCDRAPKDQQPQPPWP